MKIKKNIIRVLIVFSVFFVIGFITNWMDLERQYQDCINKRYSTVVHSDGKDFNDWWMEMHDDFSFDYRVQDSIAVGVSEAIFVTIVVSFFYILYKLFTSKNTGKIGIGIALVIFAVLVVGSWIYFVLNFHWEF